MAAGKIEKAIELADVVIKQHRGSDVYYDCALILARAYHLKGATARAIQYATLILDESDRADLRGEAGFLLGSISYRDGGFSRTLEHYLDAYPLVVRSSVRAEIRDAIKVICERKLPVPELERIAHAYVEHPLSDYMLSVLALRAIEQGDDALAIRSASRVLTEYPGSGYADDMKELLAGTGEEPREEHVTSAGQAVIGVLCPLSGKHESIGLQMSRAAQLALSSKDDDGNMVALKLVDTESDPIVSVKSALELCDDNRTVALVGGTSRSEIYALAAVGQCAAVPFVSLASAEPGLSSLGEYVFLTEPGPEEQGSVIARFALEELRIEHFSILSPGTLEGRLSREGFLREIDEGGGHIIEIQEYQEGKTDFGPELRAIATSLDLFMSSLQESTITAIFVPAAGEDAYLIAPQVRFHGIESVFLVTSQWASEEIAERGGEYIDAAFAVASPRLGEFYSGQYQDFMVEYMTEYGEAPDKFAGDAFVAVSDVLRAISDRGTSRRSVKDAMEEIRAESFARAGENVVGIMRGQLVSPDVLKAVVLPPDTTAFSPYE